jgi:hypothetical protein
MAVASSLSEIRGRLASDQRLQPSDVEEAVAKLETSSA